MIGAPGQSMIVRCSLLDLQMSMTFFNFSIENVLLYIFNYFLFQVRGTVVEVLAGLLWFTPSLPPPLIFADVGQVRYEATADDGLYWGSRQFPAVGVFFCFGVFSWFQII